MGYSCYELRDGTFGGYGVPCICTHPDCNKKIDRGVGQLCGGDPHNDEYGCTMWFCEDHLNYMPRRGGGVNVCEKCKKLQKPFKRKPESKERVNHVSKDESRKEWRKDNKLLLEKWKKEAI